jgi:energy-coupling factor transporter ATP-binding protein EcfA2
MRGRYQGVQIALYSSIGAVAELVKLQVHYLVGEQPFEWGSMFNLKTLDQIGENGIFLGPHLRLAAFQVALPNKRDIWISPRSGLNIIYGQNGNSKTTVINAISDLLANPIVKRSTTDGGKKLSGAARGFFQLDGPLNVYEIYAAAKNSFGSSSLDPADDLFQDEFESWVEKILDRNGARLQDEDSRQLLLSWIRNIPYEGSFLSSPHHSVQYLMARQAEQLREEFDFRDRTVDEVSDRLQEYGVIFPSHDYLELDVELIDLELIRKLCWEDQVKLQLYVWLEQIEMELNYPALDAFSSFYDLFEAGKFELAEDTPLSAILQDPKFFQKMLVKGVISGLPNQTFWFEADSDHEWAVGFALPMYNQQLSESNEELRNFLLTPWDEQGALGHEMEILARQALFERQWIICKSDSRHWTWEELGEESQFLALDAIDSFREWKVPSELCREINLDYVSDPLTLVREELRQATYDLELPVLLSNGEDDNQGTDTSAIDLSELQELVKRAESMIRSFNLGITDVVMRLSNSLRDWGAGSPISLKYKTLNTRDVEIDFESLSGAQRYWVSAAFKIIKAPERSIILADEPESGLHERAAHHVFRTLASTGQNIIICSHSVSALRQRSANLVHFERTPEGFVRSTRVGLGSDVQQAAMRLGTSTFDLLALKRLLIVAEGAHDVGLVNALIDLSQDPGLADATLVIPARGVRNVAQVADSAIITEFTDMAILALVDNGRAPLLSEIIDRANAMISDGMSRSKVVKSVIADQTALNPSPEERVMFDLIVRSIERGITDRLRIFALSVKDIIETVPPRSFGLDLGWSELREHYESVQRREDFKTWLRDYHGAQISTKRIVDGFMTLDVLPNDLAELLQEIQILASLGSLE